jgi:lipopolysaccharide biosynthesis glycosyltransferase
MPGEQNASVSRETQRLVTMAVDDNMAYAACVLISSLKDSAREPFVIALGFLQGTLSQENQDLLRNVCQSLHISLKFEELETDTRFITQGHISATTFTKFQLSDLYQQPHLWIDADTIALPGWDALFEVVDKAPPQAGLVVAERGEIGTTKRVDDPSSLPFNAGILGWPAGPRANWNTALDELEVVSTQEQFLLNSLYAESAMRVSEKFNMMTYRIDSLNREDLPFIIHYAGAHKPWQLSPRFRNECIRHQCPWAQWYASEEVMHKRSELTSLESSFNRGAHFALGTGVARTDRQHTGLRVVKTLNFLGPLGWPLVLGAKLFSRHIPRGTHPLH